MDMFHLPIRAIVIEGEPPIDLDDVVDEEERGPCDDLIDPWGSFILCRKCLTHHLAWWSKNLGYYECQKCWHFHVTQEWLDALAAKELQERIDKVKKASQRDDDEAGIIGPPWVWFYEKPKISHRHISTSRSMTMVRWRTKCLSLQQVYYMESEAIGSPSVWLVGKI